MTIPKVSLKDLLESGAHFGHQTKRWNPKMEEYLYGAQGGVHVFDLAKTKEAIESALSFLSQASKDGKTICFVGSKKQAREKIIEVAKGTGSAYVAERWLGGTLTNFPQIKISLNKLADMKEARAKGEYAKYTKKERVLLDREIERLERLFGGISNLNDRPDILVIVDCRKEATALREARRVGVATVGIVDSNSDPSMVDYPIPMNDDAEAAIGYVLDLVAKTLVKK